MERAGIGKLGNLGEAQVIGVMLSACAGKHAPQVRFPGDINAQNGASFLVPLSGTVPRIVRFFESCGS